MATVGLRELKNNLSKYVRRVQEAGEVIQVTDRGKIVAEIRAPANVAIPAGVHPGLAELARQGRLTLRTATTKFTYPLLPKALKRGTSRQLLDWTRGKR